jgi:site-specific recombinase XerC
MPAGFRPIVVDKIPPTVRVRSLGATVVAEPTQGCGAAAHAGLLAATRDLACFAQEGDEGLVFTSPAGKPLRHSNFRRRVWLPALRAAQLPAIHFHDLRHTGNTLAANAGASLRELMDRMGHDSERAAMIYLHGSDERQQKIADTLSKLAAEELKWGSKRQGGQASARRSGTQRARNRKQAA